MNIPKGFVLVPVEPTRIQLVAGLGTNGIHPIYCAMVAAAPPVELAAYDEAKERELFEAFAIKDAEECGLEPDGMSLNSEGYYLNQNVQCAWFGWKACAKSRSRSAE